jgi:hypothetical protein
MSDRRRLTAPVEVYQCSILLSVFKLKDISVELQYAQAAGVSAIVSSRLRVIMMCYFFKLRRAVFQVHLHVFHRLRKDA